MVGKGRPMKDPTTWLDNEFFQTVLRHAYNDRTVTVEDFFINLSMDAGEQYASTIYRSTVEFWMRGRVKTIHLVNKLVTSKVNQLADGSSYENELNLYRNVLGKMNEILIRAGEEDTSLAPELMYASTDPQPILVFEDISSKKYKLHKGLMNYEDSKVVAAKLAKFHATSHLLQQDASNKYLDKLAGGLFKKKPNQGVKFMEENFGIFTEELAKWEGFEQYAEKFQNLLPTFIERGQDIYNPENENLTFKVLNHGDFHYNNMLVKFNQDESSVEDVIFIDFQLSFWGSPAVDLYYLLYLVCDKETRDNHRDEIIHHYHQQLAETLKKTGHLGKVPDLLDINSDLLRCGFLEVVIAVCFIPFLFACYNTAINVYDNVVDAKAYRRQLFNNPQYREIIEPLLPYFLHKGFLD